jgi:hypothetical protein
MLPRISEERLWSQIVAQAWCDDGLMKKLWSEPRTMLAEYGLTVPSDTAIQVEEGTEVKVEDTHLVRHFILPVSPPDGLTDEDLVGDVVGYCGACGGCGCRCRCR